MMKKLKIGLISLLAAAFIAGPMPAIKGAIKPSKPLASIVLTVPYANAMETKEEGWPVPDLTGYTKMREEYKDKDDDGAKETLMEVFFKEGEGYITKYSTPKSVWAWGKMKSKGDNDGYGLRDPDCDGVYEEKYRTNEDFCIPPCAK